MAAAAAAAAAGETKAPPREGPGVKATVCGVIFRLKTLSKITFCHVCAGNGTDKGNNDEDAEDEDAEGRQRAHSHRNQREHVTVVIKSPSSLLRRALKTGDLAEFTGVWEHKPTDDHRQLLVRSFDGIRVVRMRHSSGPQCQALQAEFMSSTLEKKKRSVETAVGESKTRQTSDAAVDTGASPTPAATFDNGHGKPRHGQKIRKSSRKRLQAAKVAELLLRIFADEFVGECGGDDNNNGDLIAKSTTGAARRLLSLGSGVVDAAGGSGFVSLALSLRGVKSTVVDARESVGCLPRRDRKALRKAIRRRPGEVVEFGRLRAWFGEKPAGADLEFDGGQDDAGIPVCSTDSDDGLLAACSAVVGLHPDEATGAVVEWAVKNRKPFLVVPCCVFSRLFPERTTPDGRPVTSYEDLIEWIKAKDPSIRTTTLDFAGKNLAVWASWR